MSGLTPHSCVASKERDLRSLFDFLESHCPKGRVRPVPYVRASNEGSLGPRVARAWGTARPAFFVFPVYLPRPIHHHRHTHQAHRRSDDIESIRLHMIDQPAPEDRENDEPAAVRGIELAEVRRLIGRHDAGMRMRGQGW
jgi:hypothetical protein